MNPITIYVCKNLIYYVIAGLPMIFSKGKWTILTWQWWIIVLIFLSLVFLHDYGMMMNM